MITLSDEQVNVVRDGLGKQCVIACAGSGKTRAAVHRLAHVRTELRHHRGRVALLSFSNVAVDTFRKDYAVLADALPSECQRSRVEICTLDAFITANILRPHGYRTMGASVSAFLVTGTERFLDGFKFNNGSFPQPITAMEVGFTDGQADFYSRFADTVTKLDRGGAEGLVSRLGKVGAYTHNLGRYWCYRTLVHQPGILRALVRRYPHILIDEAQDIGSSHRAILELLSSAGVYVSLIGDPNQGIYEFAGADGSYLKAYAAVPGVKKLELTKNYRSIPSILALANKISGRSDSAYRWSEKHGAYFVAYKKTQRDKLVEAFRAAVSRAGLDESRSAVLCRGRNLADSLRGEPAEAGQGVTKTFVRAALHRDKDGNYLEAFTCVASAVVALLKEPRKDLLSQIVQVGRFPEVRDLRQIIWKFTRNADHGLPASNLVGDTEWHILLRERVSVLLKTLENALGLEGIGNLGQILSKRDLPNCALLPPASLPISEARPIRIETVHQVKGESLDAVLYVAEKKHLELLLSGVGHEIGRIGYVAVTRARDLFWLGIPSSCAEEFRHQLIAAGFQEIEWAGSRKRKTLSDGRSAQFKLPFA